MTDHYKRLRDWYYEKFRYYAELHDALVDLKQAAFEAEREHGKDFKLPQVPECDP